MKIPVPVNRYHESLVGFQKTIHQQACYLGHVSTARAPTNSPHVGTAMVTLTYGNGFFHGDLNLRKRELMAVWRGSKDFCGRLAEWAKVNVPWLHHSNIRAIVLIQKVPMIARVRFAGMALLLTASFAIYHYCKPSKTYGIFLCHHKYGAGVLTRWLKMMLSNSIDAPIFLDADQFESLDTVVPRKRFWRSTPTENCEGPMKLRSLLGGKTPSKSFAQHYTIIIVIIIIVTIIIIIIIIISIIIMHISKPV